MLNFISIHKKNIKPVLFEFKSNLIDNDFNNLPKRFYVFPTILDYVLVFILIIVSFFMLQTIFV